MPKLGVDKKHTPIISVRPFVRDVRPGKVNMVPPMVNGEIVTKPKAKEEPPQQLTASAEASLAAALVSAVAVLGVDLASLGIVENFDVAVRELEPQVRIQRQSQKLIEQTKRVLNHGDYCA